MFVHSLVTTTQHKGTLTSITGYTSHSDTSLSYILFAQTHQWEGLQFLWRLLVDEHEVVGE